MSESPLFRLKDVRCTRALEGVDLALHAGEFVALCGLNGAGKSTLLEIMCGLLADFTGVCEFQNRAVAKWNPRALARSVSFLPQTAERYPSFTALDVVRMGRYPHGAGWGESSGDDAICTSAMQLAGCAELADRSIDQLSGGERQRVLFAAALAQSPAALLLDEPGVFVDLPHQIQMFRTVRDLCVRQGVLCVAATHDLNLAAAFCSRIVLLDGGRVACDGAPQEALPHPAFGRAFGNHVRVESDGSRLRVHYEI